MGARRTKTANGLILAATAQQQILSTMCLLVSDLWILFVSSILSLHVFPGHQILHQLVRAMKCLVARMTGLKYFLRYFDFSVQVFLCLVNLFIYFCAFFVDRILDRVDPSLETYGEPLIWRGSHTEVKFSRALNLPSCSCEVS